MARRPDDGKRSIRRARTIPRRRFPARSASCIRPRSSLFPALCVKAPSDPLGRPVPLLYSPPPGVLPPRAPHCFACLREESLVAARASRCRSRVADDPHRAAQKVGESTYDIWLAPLQLAGVRRRALILTAPPAPPAGSAATAAAERCARRALGEGTASSSTGTRPPARRVTAAADRPRAAQRPTGAGPRGRSTRATASSSSSSARQSPGPRCGADRGRAPR